MEPSLPIGVGYIIIGVIGVYINSMAAVLIAIDKELRHVTYTYMVQLCVCDILVLTFASIYTGFALIFRSLLDDTVNAICGYMTSIGWYGSSYATVLIALSRCVQLVWSHKIDVFFPKRLVLISIVALYVCPALFYIYNLPNRPLVFYVSTVTYSWMFNTKDVYGNALSIVNITSNLICAALVTGLNIRSLHWVRKTRQQIQSLENVENRKREVRLFIQCAITGTLFTFAVMVFFVVSTLGLGGHNVIMFVLTHVGWMMIHLENPLIYFAINGRLRRRFLRLFRCSRSPDKSVATVANVSAQRFVAKTQAMVEVSER